MSLGFDRNALRFVYSYLKENKGKIDNEYSELQEILFGVPQGSIPGLLLFNIFLWDLFFPAKSTDIASYADGTTSPFY